MACCLNFTFLSSLIMFSSYLSTIHGVFLEESHIILPTERTERFTRLHYYFHDILQGEHPTTVKIAEPFGRSIHGFGVTFMADNPLTEGPEPSSKLVGRAQGTYAVASQRDLGFQVVTNFVFTEGQYQGSSLSMLGRYAIEEKVREMPIVGGSGVFRFARGYALATTFWSDLTTESAIVEYNVSVYHV